jgi:hypothetical protein
MCLCYLASAASFFLLGSNFNTFCHQSRAVLVEMILMLFMGTAFGKNAPKYGVQHKSCSLKCASKCKWKCNQNQRASFEPFTFSSNFVHYTNWLVKLTPGDSIGPE